MSQRQSQVPALSWHLPVAAAELPSSGQQQGGHRAPAGARPCPRLPGAQQGSASEAQHRWQHVPPSPGTFLARCSPPVPGTAPARGPGGSGPAGQGAGAAARARRGSLAAARARQSRAEPGVLPHPAHTVRHSAARSPLQKKGTSCPGFLRHFQQPLPLCLSFPATETPCH